MFERKTRLSVDSTRAYQPGSSVTQLITILWIICINLERGEKKIHVIPPLLQSLLTLLLAHSGRDYIGKEGRENT